MAHCKYCGEEGSWVRLPGEGGESRWSLRSASGVQHFCKKDAPEESPFKEYSGRGRFYVIHQTETGSYKIIKRGPKTVFSSVVVPDAEAVILTMAHRMGFRLDGKLEFVGFSDHKPMAGDAKD